MYRVQQGPGPLDKAECIIKHRYCPCGIHIIQTAIALKQLPGKAVQLVIDPDKLVPATLA